MKSDKPEATLNITKFGSFTANFKALPPSIPPEYIATLFTVVVTAFVGTWLIPSVIGWRKSRNQWKKIEYYHNKTNSLYDDDKLDEKDIDELDYLRNNMTQEYTTGKHSKGKINNEKFNELKKDISIIYADIYRKK